MMYIRLTLPDTWFFRGNRTYFVDARENWTVQQVAEDIAYAARVPHCKLQSIDGADFESTALAHEIFSNGDTVVAVEV